MDKTEVKSNFVIKILVLIAIIIAVIVGILLILKYTKKDVGQDNKLTLEKYEVSELKEIDIDVPSFKISIEGAYQGEITPEILSDFKVPIYEFSAGILKENKVVTTKYVGYKLVDIVGAMDIVEYSSLEFKDADEYARVMKRVSDNEYIIFMEEEKNIEPLLLIVDKPYDRSLEAVKKLQIYNEKDSDETENNN